MLDSWQTAPMIHMRELQSADIRMRCSAAALMIVVISFLTLVCSVQFTAVALMFPKLVFATFAASIVAALLALHGNAEGTGLSRASFGVSIFWLVVMGWLAHVTLALAGHGYWC